MSTAVLRSRTLSSFLRRVALASAPGQTEIQSYEDHNFSLIIDCRAVFLNSATLPHRSPKHAGEGGGRGTASPQQCFQHPSLTKEQSFLFENTDSNSERRHYKSRAELAGKITRFNNHHVNQNIFTQRVELKKLFPFC